MKNWFNRNYKTVIILSFLIPIITVALVSISHVTKWYGISNPLTWAIYLSIGIEIAALSALAAISADMGKKVYFPFGIVTLIQFIGNIYFAYSYIDINSQSFISWVELVAPLLEFMGVDPTDYVGHKRFLAFFAGGMLPIISLSFLHMLVKFTQDNKSQTKEETSVEKETPVVEAKDIVGEVSRVRLNDEQLVALEKILTKKTSEEPIIEEKKTLIKPEPETQPQIVEETPTNDEEMVNKWENNESLEGLTPMNEESPVIDLIQPNEIQIIEEPTPIVEPVVEEPEPVVEDMVSVQPEPTIVEPIVPYEEPTQEIQETIIEESPQTDIIEEPTSIIEPVAEEPIQEVEETQPMVEEQPTPQVEETPIVELPTVSEEEKKN